jgi:signal peptidase I
MSERKQRGFLREVFGVIIPALVIAGLVQSFVFKMFRIPSESMLPNLLVGDYILVTKYNYGYSRYSFPFTPPLFTFEGRVFGAAPKRGDVIVFRLPTDDSVDYIKRVIGLPGDSVQMIEGVLHVNGEPVPKARTTDFVLEESGVGQRVPRYRETLPGGVAHTTLDLMRKGPLDNTEVYRVPPGHLFMMGDNRDDSTDSRVLNEVGYVPFDNIIGRAEFVMFSVGHGAGALEFWRWPSTVRWGRLFTGVQ